ncbi:MAG: DNA internalization-related competence protein ComEC/Rec2 [Pseudomonas sp.]
MQDAQWQQAADSEQGGVPLVATAIGLLVGVVAALWWPGLLPRWGYAVAFALVLPIVRLRRRGMPLAALLVGFGLAGLQAAHVLAGQLPTTWEGREVIVQGRIEGLPQPEPRRTRFVLKVDDAATQPALLRGRRVQVSWYDDFAARAPGPRSALRAGAQWRLSLRLRAPRGLSNPGGFDAERHALGNRIVATALVRRPESAMPLAPPRGVDAWREAMATRIDAVVAGSGAAYVRALALGDTRGLGDPDWEVLRSAGLTHLIAISGFHVGMVAGFAALVLQGLWWLVPGLGRVWPRRHAAALGALSGGAGYAVLAGLSLPTVRTLLMIAVAVLVGLARRRGNTPQTLAIALLAVLLFDPLSVLFAGFWLSFAGVAWLVWCLPTGPTPLLRGFLAAQRVATIGLVPLTLALFDQVSLVGPLANLLAIPWWTLVVVPLALVGTALEAALPGAGGWAWQAAAWCFEASWRLFQWLARSPVAAWWAPESGAWALLLALLGAFWMLMPRGTPGRALGVLLWLPICMPDRELPGEGEVDLLVMDVGQGLAVLVRTRSHALLYDAGPAVAEGFDAGERVVVPALRASGVRRLDRIVLSHADADHAGGHAAVQRVFPVPDALAPPGAPLDVRERCAAGSEWRWDGVRFRFLHPSRGFPYLRNESSCVLRVETAHGAVLLTGDIGDVIEQRLLRDHRADLRADVVLAPHHGSGGSSQPGFVRATGARLALVSTGHGNRFRHPRADVVRRWREAGAELLNTADSGAIRVWIGRAGMQVRERRPWRRRLWDAAERHRAAAILSADVHVAGVPEG